MSCERTRQSLDAYVDGELGAAAAADLDAHFGACPACTRLREERRALSARLGQASRFPAPEGLRRAVLGRLRPAEPKPRGGPGWTFAGAFSVAAGAAAFVAGIWLGPLSPDDPLLDQMVASHVASLAPGAKLVAVASSDRHTIKPWFAGRTDIAPLVRDLSAEGFDLVGGRLDRVGDRETAAVVYRIRNHYVNLFMWRAPSHAPQPLEVTQARGFPFATWAVGGVRYAAISDVQGSDLERFARLASAP